MRLTRIYTKTGDSGSTSLATGDRVSKADGRIEIYGTVDELNAHLGVLVAEFESFFLTKLSPIDELAENQKQLVLHLRTSFIRVQNELFDLGSELATPREKLAMDRQRVICSDDISKLEGEIDLFSGQLPPLKNFVLPGPGILNAQAHVCRTVCRRAERQLVAHLEKLGIRAECLIFLNRLSDWFFVVSRWLSLVQNKPETLWLQAKPGQ